MYYKKISFLRRWKENLRALFLKCPQCGSRSVSTGWTVITKTSYTSHPYEVNLPIRHCHKCLWHWQDKDCEKIWEEAIEEAKKLPEDNTYFSIL